jgi:hypothetical protein
MAKGFGVGDRVQVNTKDSVYNGETGTVEHLRTNDNYVVRLDLEGKSLGFFGDELKKYKK